MNYAILAQSAIDGLSQENKDTLLADVVENAWSTDVHSITAPDEVILKWEGATNPCTACGAANTEYSYANILLEIVKPHWDSAGT